MVPLPGWRDYGSSPSFVGGSVKWTLLRNPSPQPCDYFLFPFLTPGRNASPHPLGRPDLPAPLLPQPPSTLGCRGESRMTAPLGLGRSGTARGAAGVELSRSTWRSRGVVISAGAGRREAGSARRGRTAVLGAAPRPGASRVAHTGKWAGSAPPAPAVTPRLLGPSPCPLSARSPERRRQRQGLPCW